ncbi:MAG TPA: cytochrome ubiquinol oxidase subunit I [Solirubrobacteraceae bacterium]|jgi:cytochrome d ubiquinol oxidase subunit I
MSTDLARWQFATTSIYHFLFVPVTIGLAFLVAVLQTAWYRSGNLEQRRLTRFFGTLLLINVAVGVVTGLVQEFEFGMNWSDYSRFVGDVFGAPLAMEGLGAFFLESTFLGLWLFGWDRLPKKLHLACIWLVAFGSMLSAAFILAANSWMQHPVGYSVNPTTHQPQLSNVLALFTNPTFLWGYVHVILASLVTGCVVMLAVSVWYLRRGIEATAFKRSAHLALVVLIPTLGLALFVGSELGVVEDKYQPVKIAAAEAQWTNCQPCSFSAFQIGGGKSDKTPTKVIAIPDLLSFLATNSFNGKVVGLNQLQQQYTKQYGPGNYIPDVFIQYWSMRVMAYLAAGLFLLAAWGGWLLHRRRLERSKWFLRIAMWAAVVPFLMNTAGWMLTENGRQPWIVQGLMKTLQGVSPSVSSTEIWISLIVFVALYLALGAADLFLMLRYARRGLPDAEAAQPDPGAGPTAAPELAY